MLPPQMIIIMRSFSFEFSKWRDKWTTPNVNFYVQCSINQIKSLQFPNDSSHSIEFDRKHFAMRELKSDLSDLCDIKNESKITFGFLITHSHVAELNAKEGEEVTVLTIC